MTQEERAETVGDEEYWREEAGRLNEELAEWRASDNKKASTPQQQIIAMVLGHAQLWRDAERTGYVSVRVDKHVENYRIGSSAFKKWVIAKYGMTYRSTMRDGRVVPRTVKDNALKEAIAQLEGMAAIGEREFEPCVRTGRHGDKLYIDLGRDDWSVVEIAATGWRVIDDAPVKFLRPQGMRSLPLPVQNGEPITELLRPFLNVARGDFVLLVGVLIQLYWTTGPHPVTCVFGQHSSAKTVVCLVLRRCTDPNKTPIAKLPADYMDIPVTAQQQGILVYDNVSVINASLSDILCQVATGLGSNKRALYTNDEQHSINVCRPIILNGIMEGLTRPDLNDRALALHLPNLVEKLPEEEFWERFEEKLPRILGRLLDGVVASIAHYREMKVDTEKLRLIDFARRAEAGCRALGFAAGEFERAYIDNREQSREIAMSANPVASAIKLMIGAGEEFRGKMEELRQVLEHYGSQEAWINKSRAWPSSPHKLSWELRRVAPDLFAQGIEILFRQRLNANDKNGVVVRRREGWLDRLRI